MVQQVWPEGPSNQVSSRVSCAASSRVGATTKAEGMAPRAFSPACSTGSGQGAGPGSSRSRAITRPMATVLPDPVWDESRRSRPATSGSRTARWMGVRVVNPRRDSAPNKGRGRSSRDESVCMTEGGQPSRRHGKRYRQMVRRRRARLRQGLWAAPIAEWARGTPAVPGADDHTISLGNSISPSVIPSNTSNPSSSKDSTTSSSDALV